MDCYPVLQLAVSRGDVLSTRARERRHKGNVSTSWHSDKCRPHGVLAFVIDQYQVGLVILLEWIVMLNSSLFPFAFPAGSRTLCEHRKGTSRLASVRLHEGSHCNLVDSNSARRMDPICASDPGSIMSG